MKRWICWVSILMMSVGCAPQNPDEQQRQAFCVQYANTTGFAGQGGRTVVFTAFDANSRDTELVIPIMYDTTLSDGSAFRGSSFTFDPPADVGSAFASNLLRFNGVPPIEFTATIDSGSLTTMGTTVSCTIPQIMGIGGQLSLGNDVWRVEVNASGNIECVTDQGSCN